MKFWIGIFFILLTAGAYAQNEISVQSLLWSANVSQHDLTKLEKKYQDICTGLQRHSLHLLHRLQINDSAVMSLRDRSLIPSIPPAITSIDYLPGLDSMQTALQFLVRSKFPNSNLPSLQRLNDRVAGLQDQLQQANAIQAFIAGRLQQGEMVSQSLQRQLYYYRLQVQQYKDLLHDPDRLAGKLLNAVRDRPDFRAFFSKNSYLAALFRLPGKDGAVAGQPLPGLQTREQVAAMVSERLGPGASFVSAVSDVSTGNSNPLSGNMQEAQDRVQQLKDKVSSLGGNGGDVTMPDFHPNPYHTKTLLQRIQMGFDVQTQSSSGLAPALSTIGISAGYLLNARSIVGVGLAYKIGWGRPFDHISFSSQGMAVRSFLDWRLKGSLWMAGGYEANYYNAFGRLSQLREIHAWQQSALLGVMKTYKAGKRAGNVQLLFDALYRQHIPQSQPVVFRVGYTL